MYARVMCQCVSLSMCVCCVYALVHTLSCLKDKLIISLLFVLRYFRYKSSYFCYLFNAAFIFVYDTVDR